ncbi:hypothetical protein [Agromyces kandeliae]|uniref:hypothetical protein n=1 Tax=Agromyces kandeliae TaxID=2666141 RepID=UPI002D21A58E|nr:hypothetical protein [Agromyces kandeliae]
MWWARAGRRSYAAVDDGLVVEVEDPEDDDPEDDDPDDVEPDEDPPEDPPDPDSEAEEDPSFPLARESVR